MIIAINGKKIEIKTSEEIDGLNIDIQSKNKLKEKLIEIENRKQV